MVSTHSRSNASQATKRSPRAAQSTPEATQDMMEAVTEYARENPGYAALICLGVGFVLGWKLKPW
jgi:ElaB/YqjD/DUF883 family membrane-anchored ribosome-binding protein